ncbi:MAG: RNA polymerase subunit sigma-70 [Crocinitomicaceae bacterium]|nr:RNA polymerase subunit sigma-70 [Crocinitomicaceae bacterium]|tara:strand:+ start:51861 stop:52382 length:522 start_codon:yes stop_codon:yes gene_type:complete
MEEAKLIKKCIKGDIKAQRALFNRFAPKMFGVCLRYAKDKNTAEDVLQEGFVKVFFNIEKFKGGSLEGWIRKIMVNTSLDEIRKNTKFKNNVNIEKVKQEENKNYILEGLIAQDILNIINKMPSGYKVVFNLFAIEGYSHKEIGEKLGISESTSKSQYFRARNFLQKKIETIK